MNVLLNGKERRIPDGRSVADLLTELKMPPRHVAVEINKELVTRDTYAQTYLHDADRVEIVAFVGGG